MALKTGTHDIDSLLAVENQSVLDYGLPNVQAAIQRELAIHNQIMSEMVSTLAQVTTERATTYGGISGGEMIEVDEYGRGPTQKEKGFAQVAFPLRKFQYNVGWTSTWFKVHTPADMARAFLNGNIAHVRRVQDEIRKALFPATNYTIRDHLVDNIDIPVKRLVNADSAIIPVGPNGETFDGATHTHYNAVDWSGADAAARIAAVNASITDLVEHGHGGSVKMFINRADEAKVRAMTTFEAYVDPRIIYRATDTPGRTLDISRLDNRAIGLLGAAEVWVKPWVPANYFLFIDEAGPKTLAFRQRDSAALQGLQLVNAIDAHPLYAEYMEAEFGMGVWNRTNGVVLYINDGTYASP